MKKFSLFVFILLVFFALPNLALAQTVYKVGDKNTHIATVQKYLPTLGIKVDRTDGTLSKKTSKAIKVFQKKSKLNPTGLLDNATYEAILAAVKKKPVPLPSSPATKIGSDIIKTASQYKGVPYKFGGVDTRGFDCSGYTCFVFQKNNINLPRTADVQFKAGTFVLKKDLKPGDLVFFETYEKGPSHVGIYAGNGNFWHASSSKGVMLSGLNDTYWKTRYVGSRRILK